MGEERMAGLDEVILDGPSRFRYCRQCGTLYGASAGRVAAGDFDFVMCGNCGHALSVIEDDE